MRQTTVRYAALLMIAASLAGFAQQKKGKTKLENDRLLKAWLTVVERAERYGFDPAPSIRDIPKTAFNDSVRWADECFTESANPHREGISAETSIHRARRDTPDLIRIRYRDGGSALTYIEGINFIVLRVEGQQWTKDSVTTAVRRYLRPTPAEGLAAFDVPERPVNGARFSTSEQTDPMDMVGWPSRLDGGIENSELFFFVYKKHPQRAAYQDGQSWFGESPQR